MQKIFFFIEHVQLLATAAPSQIFFQFSKQKKVLDRLRLFGIVEIKRLAKKKSALWICEKNEKMTARQISKI